MAFAVVMSATVPPTMSNPYSVVPFAPVGVGTESRKQSAYV